MTKKIFISLPVTDLPASIAFYKALGFEQSAQFSDDTAACMAWSESIQVMLLTHAKWRTFTDRPFPPAGTSGLMLSLAMDSREAVDAMNRAIDYQPCWQLGHSSHQASCRIWTPHRQSRSGRPQPIELRRTPNCPHRELSGHA